MHRSFLAIVSLVAAATAGVASAAPADPVLQKIIAGAAAVPPASTSFERTTRVVERDESGAAETTVRVDRWDGKLLSLVSINGKPATAGEIADFRKAAAARPMAGYYRLATFVSAGARRTGEKPGQLLYRIDHMPKGSVDLNGDKSDKFSADLTVDTSGPVPVVSRLHIFLPKPFSIMFVAKVDKFDVVNDYAAGKDGRPALVHSVQQLAGAQFGKAGETRTEISYTPVH
jgi:hypothetical protein